MGGVMVVAKGFGMTTMGFLKTILDGPSAEGFKASVWIASVVEGFRGR